jgi:hypothetical protein
VLALTLFVFAWESNVEKVGEKKSARNPKNTINRQNKLVCLEKEVKKCPKSREITDFRGQKRPLKHEQTRRNPVTNLKRVPFFGQFRDLSSFIGFYRFLPKIWVFSDF